MRWRFFDPSDPAEAADHAATLARIDAWWQAFTEREADLRLALSGEKKWDFATWVTEHLQAIHPQLMWEMGYSKKTRVGELAITPELHRELRPCVETILERAPRSLGWDFYAYRQAIPPDKVLQYRDSRARCDRSKISFTLEPRPDHLINLRYYSPEFSAATEAEDGHACFLLTEGVVGEELLDLWVGGLGPVLEPPPAAPQEPRPLTELRPALTRAIAEQRGRLLAQPCYERVQDAKWTALKRPEIARLPEYANQDDRWVGISMVPGVVMSAFDSVFTSERFTRCDEKFAYLKVDGGADVKAAYAEHGDAIMAAIDAALGKSKLGCCTGRGMGVKYWYMDLALIDVDKAAEFIRDIVQRRGLSRRSWLLFFDTAWSQEWIGMWPDSPVPPLPAVV